MTVTENCFGRIGWAYELAGFSMVYWGGGGGGILMLNDIRVRDQATPDSPQLCWNFQNSSLIRVLGHPSYRWELHVVQ
jgi:hypothetical protein